MLKQTIQKLRLEYGNTPLLEEDLNPNPFLQFQKWLQEAIKAQVMEPNGMTLATISELGRPTCRTVLLKSCDKESFSFFTNYESRKGKHLQAHPFGSLTFWWREIYRQVNIEGYVEKTSSAENQLYFKTRLKGAQAAARASLQSQPLATREELEEKFHQIKKMYRGKEISCPINWGGYSLIPDRIEFWQGRKDRLHDRFVFVRVNGEWMLSRLYP